MRFSAGLRDSPWPVENPITHGGFCATEAHFLHKWLGMFGLSSVGDLLSAIVLRPRILPLVVRPSRDSGPWSLWPLQPAIFAARPAMRYLRHLRMTFLLMMMLYCVWEVAVMAKKGKAGGYGFIVTGKKGGSSLSRDKRTGKALRKGQAIRNLRPAEQ